MAFLTVVTGVTVVPITDTPSMRPAVACWVGALLPAGVLGAPAVPSAAAIAVVPTLALLGVKLGMEGLDLVGQVGVCVLTWSPGEEGGLLDVRTFKSSSSYPPPPLDT